MEKKLEGRKELDALRQLMPPPVLIDFFSNDYLGLAKCKKIYDHSLEIMKENSCFLNGSTGSRLLSGNHFLFAMAEALIARFHNAEAALLFNSGYDANLGLLSSIAQRGDIILYDESSHASIRDGISMGVAKAFKFRHNDVNHLLQLIEKYQAGSYEGEIFVVTESVFSMDGDKPDLIKIADLTNKLHCRLIVDEAHATGVLGKNGEGLVHQLGLQEKVFARIVTFGKALGAHGAAILGSKELQDYLVNFSRSFIYTTGLPPHSVATIIAAYSMLPGNDNYRLLHDNIKYFRQEVKKTIWKSTL
ncbi:aminotransferase class I/II-fold pyridoxal phosphate-dependent enzyme [Antarcticibacterium flavum]|uniref:aminotransferase class I/II-fold pyridoxal phosphate-dependent enzyme n=1 Tax=Antarcticibacterium flavum TaxID=2058175 RepID=UPI002688B59B|nr:aminotransferase class I/II-fold pyridoxal phosphate-dependent enzyme [Antarcticibacterium flavum]